MTSICAARPSRSLKPPPRGPIEADRVDLVDIGQGVVFLGDGEMSAIGAMSPSIE